MTTNTTTELSYLDRVYQRLEERDNPYERNMADALSEALLFAENFVAKCNGTSDVPATRKEPGYCECVVDGSEEEEAMNIWRNVQAAWIAPRPKLTNEQWAWFSLMEWYKLGVSATREPFTTADLSQTCADVLPWLDAFKAGEPRAEMQSEVEAILKALS